MIDGQLYHTIRHGGGAWQPSFGDVNAQVDKAPKQFVAASCAGFPDAVHIVGVGDDALLHHTIRNNDGSWQTYFGLIESAVSGGVEFHGAATAAVGTDLHVVARSAAGDLFHTIRNSNGSWQNTFGVIESVVTGGGAFLDVACAGIGNTLHVVGCGLDGRLFHTIRHPDGTWQSTFGRIGSAVSGGKPFGAVGCAAVGSSLHVVAVGRGDLFHTIRNPDGTWQQTFGVVESVVSGGKPFNKVTCAGIDTHLHVVGVSAGDLFHTIRNPDRSWQPTFGVVESVVTGGPITATFAGCAGTNLDLQVITGDWEGGWL